MWITLSKRKLFRWVKEKKTRRKNQINQKSKWNNGTESEGEREKTFRLLKSFGTQLLKKWEDKPENEVSFCWHSKLPLNHSKSFWKSTRLNKSADLVHLRFNIASSSFISASWAKKMCKTIYERVSTKWKSFKAFCYSLCFQAAIKRNKILFADPKNGEEWLYIIDFGEMFSFLCSSEFSPHCFRRWFSNIGNGMWK